MAKKLATAVKGSQTKARAPKKIKKGPEGSKPQPEIFFLGIDQTGAVDSKGRPKPLPAALIRGQTVEFFYLPALSKEHIEKKLGSSTSQIMICADCVLGLPESVGVSWRAALKGLSNFTSYGRTPAQKYFYDLGKGEIHKRKIEIACKANSVFQEKPFQKNIQTGTYRLWKDIFLNENDFWIPALEKKKTDLQIPLFEGYPSFSWKLLLQASTRSPKDLTSLIKKAKIGITWTKDHQAQAEKDPNLADAFLLALTMQKFAGVAFDRKPTNEGHILGFTADF